MRILYLIACIPLDSLLVWLERRRDLTVLDRLRGL